MSLTFSRGRRRPVPIILVLALVGVLFAASPASAAKLKQYSFTFENGTTISGTSDDNVAFLAGAGGTDANNPTGMDVHVSCSDKFEGGFGEKDGPDPVADSAWKIASYSIGEVKDGVFEEKCGGPADGGDPAGIDKGKGYTFTFVNGQTITGASKDKTAFIPDAGGTDANNPTGMEVHLSCSDKFPGGFGEKDGPDPVADSAWQIESYEITEIKDGVVKEVKCQGSFAPPSPPPAPSVDLTKRVNGEDANDAPGVSVSVGETVTLSYEVVNDGTIPLSNIVVTDADLGNIPCPKTTLAVGESMDCDERTMDVLQPGPVFMEARVDADGIVSGTPTPPAADKGKAYSFTFVNGTVITGVSDDNVAFLPGAGGTDANNPTGMEVHVSCSDKFSGGFGEKDGPDRNADSAWQIASFSIVKDGKTTCGDTFQSVAIPVADEDPINYVAVDPDPELEPPSDCTAVVDGDSVKVSWTASDGATLYAVKRNNTYLGRTSNTMFVDDEAPAGETVSYSVRAIGPDSKTDYVGCGSVTVPGDDPTTPSIDLVKSVNGDDANTAPGPQFEVGDTITITYKITNTGDTDLSNIVVNDFTLGVIDCDAGTLAPGEMFTCPGVDEIVTVAGAVNMRAEVEGTSPEGVTVDDEDPINFTVVDPDPELEPPSDCTAVVDGDSVKVSWTASDGATLYAVKRNNTYLGRTSNTMFVDDEAPAGETVSYSVRAIGPDSKTDYVGCGSVTVPGDDPTGPTHCEARLVADGVEITWTAADGAKAYQVRSNGKWLIRTTSLSFIDHKVRDGYTVEAIFAGNVKSETTPCPLSSSN